MRIGCCALRLDERIAGAENRIKMIEKGTDGWRRIVPLMQHVRTPLDDRRDRDATHTTTCNANNRSIKRPPGAKRKGAVDMLGMKAMRLPRRPSTLHLRLRERVVSPRRPILNQAPREHAQDSAQNKGRQEPISPQAETERPQQRIGCER